jgi:hypothetical protein
MLSLDDPLTLAVQGAVWFPVRGGCRPDSKFVAWILRMMGALKKDGDGHQTAYH